MHCPLAPILVVYLNLQGIVPRNDSDMVSCHNDLKPENILFDGDRIWLVDWEAAFLNDRYCDLAVIANFVVTNDARKTLLFGPISEKPRGITGSRGFI